MKNPGDVPFSCTARLVQMTPCLTGKDTPETTVLSAVKLSFSIGWFGQVVAGKMVLRRACIEKVPQIYKVCCIEVDQPVPSASAGE